MLKISLLSFMMIVSFILSSRGVLAADKVGKPTADKDKVVKTEQGDVSGQNLELVIKEELLEELYREREKALSDKNKKVLKLLDKRIKEGKKEISKVKKLIKSGKKLQSDIQGQNKNFIDPKKKTVGEKELEELRNKLYAAISVGDVAEMNVLNGKIQKLKQKLGIKGTK